jgi:NADH-quinone oxidoreductase subunit C
MDFEQEIREFINSRFGEAVIAEDNFRNQLFFIVKPEAVYDICRALLDEDRLDVRLLADIAMVDWLGHEEEKKGRFELAYNLYSLKHKSRFFLRTRLPGDKPEIRSLTPLWNGANWLEREAFDMMGIIFTGHPDLTKILTPDDLEGYPLRKDFPLTYEEPRFSWNKDDPPEVIK